MSESLSIAVVGAGISGVSTAEHLRRDGHSVTLIDRIDPGAPEQTSYGNAGLLAASSIIPVPTPGFLEKVPKMLFDKDGPLFMRWSYLPRLLPWLIPFIRSGEEGRVRAIAAAIAPLISDTVEQHLALAQGTDAARFIETGDYIYLYPDREAFRKDSFGFALREDLLGSDWEERDAAALREADPALGPDYTFGAAMKHHGWLRDPGGYVAALAKHFQCEGGVFQRAEVADIQPLETGVEIRTGGEARRYDRVVLAAGVWSRRMAERLGHTVPLEAERGYHLMLRGVSHAPPCPYMLTDRKFVATPMAQGMRCAGLVEFGGIDAPPAKAPLGVLERGARRLYPGLTWESAAPWMGRRPSTPDSVPLIGESPRARGVYFAFGAQHLGLTMGPKTGRLIADLIAGRRPNLDLTAYRPDRFDR